MEQQKAIYPALHNILKDITAISKKNKNTQQNYNFRGIDDVLNEIHDSFATHGVLIVQEVIDSQFQFIEGKSSVAKETLLKIKYKFISCLDGSCVESIALGEARDFGDKGVPKAMSMALKYVLFQMFTIPTNEKLDTEYQDHETTKKPTQKPQNPPPTQKPQKTFEQHKAEGFKDIISEIDMYVSDNSVDKEGKPLKDSLIKVLNEETTEAVYKAILARIQKEKEAAKSK